VRTCADGALDVAEAITGANASSNAMETFTLIITFLLHLYDAQTP